MPQTFNLHHKIIPNLAIIIVNFIFLKMYHKEYKKLKIILDACVKCIIITKMGFLLINIDVFLKLFKNFQDKKRIYYMHIILYYD